MGGAGSGKGREIKRKSKELEKAGITAYSIGMTFTQVVLVMGFHAGMTGTTQDRIRKGLDKLGRYRKAFPDFNAELEACAARKELSCRMHAIQSAFPVTKTGEWMKGDSPIAIHLLKTLFGLRDNIESREIAQALAPLIQFSVKEPSNAVNATTAAGTYFDTPKEAGEG